jgi:hypothetical protein
MSHPGLAEERVLVLAELGTTRTGNRPVKHMVQALRPMDTYWGVCVFCHFVLPAAVYREVVKQKIPIAFTSSNHYERLPVPGSHKLGRVLKAFSRVSVTKYPGMAFHGMQAFACLAGLKAEFYSPPLRSLFGREPVPPKGLHFINTTKYFKWDVKQMVATLREIGWRPPEDVALPMRFDCKIEEGLINHTWKRHCGATVHEVICNNLIHEQVMTKQELEPTVAHYASTIDARIREVLEILQLRP